jgi:hypothetical protein
VINPDSTDPRSMSLVPPDNPGDSAMPKFFAATGRFAVRFRWAVVAAWVAATVLASLFFPSLASVTKQNNTDLLPASSPSLHAAQLATPFQGPNQTPVSVVVARNSGPVTAADITAIGRLPASLAKVTDVQQVRGLGESRDHQAVQLEVLAGLPLAHSPETCTPAWLARRPPRPTPAWPARKRSTWARTSPSCSSWSCCSWCSARCWRRC